MRNIRLTLAYDGTRYVGWQMQPNGVSVQSVVEAALRQFSGCEASLISAGRTDAGVHALGQVANFRTESAIPCRGFVAGLQPFLPDDILVRSADEVPLDFHATYAAKRKRYRYVILNAQRAHPFLGRYAHEFHAPLDERAMHEAAQVLVGTNDFCSFETQHPNTATSVRTVFEASVGRFGSWPAWNTNAIGEETPAAGEFVWFDIVADGFLYNMVRTIAGTLIRVGEHKWDAADLHRILEGRDRRNAGPTAPACGLYLVKVDYEVAPLTAAVETSAAGKDGAPPVKFRVAHVITRLIIGGAQENTLLNVEDQHRLHGDEVTLITGPGLGPEGSLEERARAGGLDLRVVPEMRRSIHPWRDWQSYRRLFRLLAEIRPQIVHTHSSKAGILGRAAAARLGIPAVHTIHGAAFHYGQSPLAHRVYIAAEKWAAPRCQRLISVCDAMTDHYVQAGIAPREQFVTIYSGMEVEPFLHPPRPRETVLAELGLRPEHVVITKVARLFHLKGHEFVIAAAGRVVRENPNVRFLFVGDGLLRGQFEEQIARGGLTHAFVFAGLVPPSKVPELVHASDIIVHTSLWEGLARVLPQALIAGKPVVSYDVDGAREVAIPGETGYLLPPQSVDELAAALCELASNPALRERLGRTGRERFTEQFRHETMTRRIREVYAEILNENVKLDSPLAP